MFEAMAGFDPNDSTSLAEPATLTGLVGRLRRHPVLPRQA